MFKIRGWDQRTLAVVLTAGLGTIAGCKQQATDPVQLAQTGADPADANLTPVDPNQPQTAASAAAPKSYGAAPARQSAPRTRVLSQQESYPGQQQAQSYPQPAPNYQGPAPIERAPDPQNYVPPASAYNGQAYQQGDENFDNTIDQYAAEQAPQPPPPLPVYEQPPCPEPNALWTPGYWSYAPAGYFWVPGAWVAAPYQGALWTPGYWGGYGNGYRFHRGFWGRHIGFYGGISYGFGYFGSGYRGGYWNGDNFYYNRAVSRVDERVVRHVYVHNETVKNSIINNRVSYNGGSAGVQARPAPYEIAAMREQHAAPMASQVQLRQQAQGDRTQFFAQNGGRPVVAVAPKPLIAEPIAAPPRVNAPVPVQPFGARLTPATLPNRAAEVQRAAPDTPFGAQHPQNNPGPAHGNQPQTRPGLAGMDPRHAGPGLNPQSTEAAQKLGPYGKGPGPTPAEQERLGQAAVHQQQTQQLRQQEQQRAQQQRQARPPYLERTAATPPPREQRPPQSATQQQVQAGRAQPQAQPLRIQPQPPQHSPAQPQPRMQFAPPAQSAPRAQAPPQPQAQQTREAPRAAPAQSRPTERPPR